MGKLKACLIIWVAILSGCSGSKLLKNEPISIEDINKVFSHRNLVDQGILFNRQTYSFSTSQNTYADKRIHYSFRGIDSKKVRILSSTTECKHTGFVTGYLLGGKRRYINYVEESLEAELVKIEDDWLLNSSLIYAVVQNSNQVGYTFIGNKGCKIYEITLVNLGLKEVGFKVAIAEFINETN